MLDCKFYIERQKQTNILFTNTNNIVSHSCYSYSFMDFFFFLSWNSIRKKNSFKKKWFLKKMDIQKKKKKKKPNYWR